MIQDRCIALSNTSRFKDNKIIAGFFANINGILYIFTEGFITFPGSQAAHIGPGMVNGIHAYPVAQQSTTGFLFGGIHRNDGNGFISGRLQETPHQFIRH